MNQKSGQVMVVLRLRNVASPILVAALSVLLLTSCSSYEESSVRSVPEVTCDDALATVLQRERTDNTTSALGVEMEWLGENCSAEHDVFVDYVSAKVSTEQSGTETCDFWTDWIGQESISLLSEDGLCTSGASEALAEAPSVEAQPGGGIPWNEAVNYAGTTQRVCGPLAGNGNSNDDLFLNLGRDYPDPGRFQIVLWDIGAVEPIPYGSKLCTSGQITLYEGVAQIELRSANSVEIYE